ncbi:uncharacterized protein LOC144911141 [Branchiostoma floridae x Branchiostoma belcheri]|nr:hypothetical protein Bbelb_002200 [Branchiostoma belcheri]
MEDKMERRARYTQYTHAFWLNCLKSAIFEVVKIEQFTFRVWTAIWTSSGQFVLRAINLKEYRADFAFEESIQNMKLCANSGSHQALASTRFLHKTCSQGK